MSSGAACRLLLVNTVAAGGGAARMARTLHSGVPETGDYETRLAVGRGEADGDEGVVRFAYPPEVGLHLAITRLTGLQGVGTGGATGRLVEMIHSWQPRVIHLHNTHGYYLDLDLLPRLRRSGWSGPVVWTLHDAWAFTGRCAYFMDCGRWRHGCGRCPDLQRYPRTFFDTSGPMWERKRRAFTTSRPLPLLVCPSRWLADAAARSFLGDADIRVIPNGVDTDRFRPGDGADFRRLHRIPPDHRIVLFAASYLGIERKGGDLAAGVMQRLAGDRVTVVTLGTTDASLPTGPAFRHLGYLGGPAEVARVFRAADLFCILSLDENFPTTVLEALASGVPVAGFAVGGIPEQVPGECGALTGAGDVEEIVEAVQAMLGDRRRLAAMARAARERAVRHYSLEVFVRRHVELYDSLLGGSGELHGEV